MNAATFSVITIICSCQVDIRICPESCRLSTMWKTIRHITVPQWNDLQEETVTATSTFYLFNSCIMGLSDLTDNKRFIIST